MLGISSSNTTSIYGIESHIFSAWFDQNEPQIDVYARPLRILVSSAARQTPDWQPCLYEKFQIFLLQNASRMQFCRGETFSCFFQLQLAQRPELRGFAGRDARDFR
ncbi:hypothetical protein B7H20_27410 [Pseudomonas aeruginosa]|nr:hypothetical protein APA88_21015 [Pseudomonas aeruginosa]ORL55166.1 hypothetical protein B7H20_27410 [Pseudomonas aeruginosa]